MNQSESASLPLSIIVSQEDIADSSSGLIGNPIARALSRATKTRWRVWDGRIAQPFNAPDMAFYLPEEVQRAWDATSDPSQLEPFTFLLNTEDPKYVS